MDTIDSQFFSKLSPSIKWSIYAGIYGFLSSLLILSILGSIASTLIKILGLQTDYSIFLMSLPVLFISPIIWWLVVERWDKYTYLFGGFTGVLTAFFTVFFWVSIFIVVWSPLLVLTGWFLILFILIISIPTAFILGLTLMYARRSLDDSL